MIPCYQIGTRMLRKFLGFVAGLALFGGLAVAAPQPAAADHSYIHSVCQWTAVEYWGPGRVDIVAWYAINWYGDTSAYYCRALWRDNDPNFYYCSGWIVDVDPGGVVHKIFLGEANCFGP